MFTCGGWMGWVEQPRIGGGNTTVVSRRVSRTFLIFSALVLLGAPSGVAQSLRGSQRSLLKAHRVAEDHDYTFISSPAQVRRFADSGYLVRVRGNRDFTLHDVSFPYARPEVELFVQRLSRQYRNACGEKLVVTSLTRPKNRQPRNSAMLSVHPTGMAVDLRRSWDGRCRSWLERVLISLEGSGVLEATRERTPSHYHVSLFPHQYGSYVEQLKTRSATNTRSRASVKYTVRSGDSLWTIARAHGVTVGTLKRVNGLRGSRIYAGQTLTLPTR
jgi:LysM repeat protein